MCVKSKERVTSPNDCPITKFGFTPVCGLNCGFHINTSLSKICSNDTGMCACVRSCVISSGKGNAPPPHRFLGPNVRRRLSLNISKHTRCIVPCFAVNMNVKTGILNHNSLQKLCRVLTLGVKVAHDAFLRVNCGLRGFRAPGCLVLNLNFHFRGGCPGMHRWGDRVSSGYAGFTSLAWGARGGRRGVITQFQKVEGEIYGFYPTWESTRCYL